MTKPDVVASSALPPDVQLRQAQRADAALIHRMVADLSAFLGETHRHQASVADYEAHGFGEHPRFSCVVAERGSEALGMCLYFDSFSTWMGKPGLYVQDLIVLDKARGLGLGRHLLTHVAAKGKAAGYAYMRLSVDAENVGAQRFYEKCGFSWSASEQLYALKGADFDAFAEGR